MTVLTISGERFRRFWQIPFDLHRRRDGGSGHGRNFPGRRRHRRHGFGRQGKGFRYKNLKNDVLMNVYNKQGRVISDFEKSFCQISILDTCIYGYKSILI